MLKFNFTINFYNKCFLLYNTIYKTNNSLLKTEASLELLLVLNHHTKN